MGYGIEILARAMSVLDYTEYALEYRDGIA